MAEPALMNDLETDEIEGQCCHCGRILPAGLWFARIQRHGRLLEFCRPRCVEQFFGGTEAVTEESEHSYNEAGFLAAAG